MVAFVINRKTGEEKVVDSYTDSKDNPLGATASILAKMIFEQKKRLAQSMQ